MIAEKEIRYLGDLNYQNSLGKFNSQQRSLTKAADSACNYCNM